MIEKDQNIHKIHEEIPLEFYENSICIPLHGNDHKYFLHKMYLKVEINALHEIEIDQNRKDYELFLESMNDTNFHSIDFYQTIQESKTKEPREVNLNINDIVKIQFKNFLKLYEKNRILEYTWENDFIDYVYSEDDETFLRKELIEVYSSLPLHKNVKKELLVHFYVFLSFLYHLDFIYFQNSFDFIKNHILSSTAFRHKQENINISYIYDTFSYIMEFFNDVGSSSISLLDYCKQYLQKKFHFYMNKFIKIVIYIFKEIIIIPWKILWMGMLLHFFVFIKMILLNGNIQIHILIYHLYYKIL